MNEPINPIHFCGLEPDDCPYRIPYDQVKHDKMIYQEGRSDTIEEIRLWIRAYVPSSQDADFICRYLEQMGEGGD